MTIRLAKVVECTEAEGPFRRFAVWVRGCSLACPGCCNPGLFATEGAATLIEDVVARVRVAASTLGIEGVTFVGGEPLEQMQGVTALAESAQALGLGVIVFSGYRLEEARALPGFERLWAAVDTLVDGRFEAGQLESRAPSGQARRVVGSVNQRLIHRTARYADADSWSPANQPVEVLIDPHGRVAVVGAPADVHRVERWLR